MTHDAPAENGSDAIPSTANARRELDAALGELVERVQPRAIARDLQDEGKRTVRDVVAAATGNGLPADDSRRKKTIAALVAAGAIAAGGIVKAIRRSR
ncbi:hypothetical protein [Rarobacter incanus]|uniref:DUF3618 domain-containing protein n=1 Tax=Rarobacter incanus TaxID=153494 RepID=A0A542SQK5_9MICO|nr:hypothetical protein [Rarobacter incanus]TQK76875.1 hypothetical protein FB389_1571 [Rarobacter incanus]